MNKKVISISVLGGFLLFSSIASAWSLLEPFIGTQLQAEDSIPEVNEYDKTSLFDMFEVLKTIMSKFDFDQQPLFTPEELQEIANIGLEDGLPLSERWEMMRAELASRYPGKIADELHWVFNSSGNVQAQLALVYASPTEYVAFFGTPVGADGFSGRYNEADVWDMMVEGEMLCWKPGEFEPAYYYPGETAYLPKGIGKGFRYVNSTWMIDYGRGNIITMFPYGVIAPALYNTLDFKSAWEQFRDYAELVIKSALN